MNDEPEVISGLGRVGFGYLFGYLFGLGLRLESGERTYNIPQHKRYCLTLDEHWICIQSRARIRCSRNRADDQNENENAKNTKSI